MSIARQVLAAFAAAALVALSGCTVSAGAEGGGATSTSDLSTTSGSTSPTSQPGGSSSTATDPGTPSATTPTAPAGPTATVAVRASITDPALGHVITVRQVQRGWAWPQGDTVAAGLFELVAVQMTWQAGTAYTASLSPDMFTLGSGARLPNLVDPVIDATLVAESMPILPATLPYGKSATGWLVFKIEPIGAKALSLIYTRPTTVVSGGETIPAKTFTVPLT